MTYTFDENLISDLHKDAKGFRPSEYYFNIWNNSSNDEKQAIWDTLINDFNDRVLEERKQENAAVDAFESQIELLMNSGAVDRTQAISWIVDSLDLTDSDKLYGEQYICYKLGLPYSYADNFKIEYA